MHVEDVKNNNKNKAYQELYWLKADRDLETADQTVALWPCKAGSDF